MICAMSDARTARCLGGYTTHLAARGLSDNTVRARTYWAARMLRETGTEPATVTTARIEEWLAGHDWKPNTRRMVVLSLRGFFAWCQTTGVRSDDPAATLTEPRVLTVERPTITDAGLRNAMDNADDLAYWAIRIASTTGLRRGELAALRGDQLHNGWLTIHGKGGRVRRVPVPPDVDRHMRGCDGYVFPGRGGVGHVHPIWVAERVRRVCGVPMHALRRHYATEVYRRSHDLRAVQELLGHASLATTQRYVGIEDDELMAAARTVWAA